MLSGSSAERCGHAHRCAGRLSESRGNAVLIRSMSPTVVRWTSLVKRRISGSGVGDSLWLHTSCNSTWKFTRRHHGAAFIFRTRKSSAEFLNATPHTLADRNSKRKARTDNFWPGRGNHAEGCRGIPGISLHLPDRACQESRKLSRTYTCIGGLFTQVIICLKGEIRVWRDVPSDGLLKAAMLCSERYAVFLKTRI